MLLLQLPFIKWSDWILSSVSYQKGIWHDLYHPHPPSLLSRRSKDQSDSFGGFYACAALVHRDNSHAPAAIFPYMVVILRHTSYWLCKILKSSSTIQWITSTSIDSRQIWGFLHWSSLPPPVCCMLSGCGHQNHTLKDLGLVSSGMAGSTYSAITSGRETNFNSFIFRPSHSW